MGLFHTVRRPISQVPTPAGPEGGFKVDVKTLTGKVFILEASPWDTIGLVKIKIEAMGGKLLPDGCSVQRRVWVVVFYWRGTAVREGYGRPHVDGGGCRYMVGGGGGRYGKQS